MLEARGYEVLEPLRGLRYQNRINELERRVEEELERRGERPRQVDLGEVTPRE